MSQLLASTERDPRDLFLKPVQQVLEGRKIVEVDVDIIGQLKPKINFDLLSLS